MKIIQRGKRTEKSRWNTFRIRQNTFKFEHAIQLIFENLNHAIPLFLPFRKIISFMR